jgi:hypothetical protein
MGYLRRVVAAIGCSEHPSMKLLVEEIVPHVLSLWPALVAVCDRAADAER